MASSWGRNIRFSIFGQSHSAAIGGVIEGLPSGFEIDMEKLSAFSKRRAPGNSPLSTPRKEADLPEFLSGLANGRTCGAPLAFLIRNTNVRPGDYSEFADIPRPGHADFTAKAKYGGFQDASGGGHFSGRLTAPLVVCGGICMQILERLGVYIGAHIARIGNVCDTPFDPVTVGREDFDRRTFSPLTVNDSHAGELMADAVNAARAENDSVGGIIECAAVGLPVGIGDPMFDGLESVISSIVFGIPAVKGVEFGSGFGVAGTTGSENNDPFVMTDSGVRTLSNNAGGILGGISNGMPLLFRAAFKPTPSIGRPQTTLDLRTGEQTELRIKGRHDPCVLTRAVPCVEAACALALCDVMLKGDCSPL